MHWIIGVVMLFGSATLVAKVTAFAARVVLGIVAFLGLLLIVLPLLMRDA